MKNPINHPSKTAERKAQDKRIAVKITLGLAVAFLLNLAFDAVDYRAHGPGWHRVQASGFEVERNNVWWNLLK